MARNVFENQAADGNSTEFKHLADQGQSPYLAVYVSGTLDGNLDLQVKAPDGTFVTPDFNTTIVDNGLYLFEAPSFIGRFVLSGSTSPDLTVAVESVHEAHIRVKTG